MEFFKLLQKNFFFTSSAASGFARNNQKSHCPPPIGSIHGSVVPLLGSGLLSARHRLEQRLKIALAEAQRPSALDELEEERSSPMIAEERTQRLHENLQQMPLTRLSVHQHTERPKPIEIVGEPPHPALRQPLVQAIVVAPRRTQEPRRVQLFHYTADALHVQGHVLDSRSAVVTNESSHLGSAEVGSKGLVQCEGDARCRTTHHHRTHPRSHLTTHALAVRARVELELPDLLEPHHVLEPPHHWSHRQEVAGEVVETTIPRRFLQATSVFLGFDEPEGQVADGRSDVHPAAVRGFVDVRDERCSPLCEVLSRVPDVFDDESDLTQPVGMLTQKLRRRAVGRSRLQTAHLAGS